MMAAATAYPLAWPDGFPRSKAREKGRFTTTLSDACAAQIRGALAVGNPALPAPVNRADSETP